MSTFGMPVRLGRILRCGLALALTPLLGLSAAEPHLEPPVTLVSPSGPGALTPQLANAPDGTIYLSWL